MNAALFLLPFTTLAVVYVHALVGSRTPGVRQAWLVRGVLVLAGLGFGWLWHLQGSALPGWFAFLYGFGLVHVPAAAILMIKRQHPPVR